MNLDAHAARAALTGETLRLRKAPLVLRDQRRLLLLEAVDELRDLPAALGEDELRQVVLLCGVQQLAHAHQERQQHRALLDRAHRAALEHLLEPRRLRDVDLLQQHLQRAQQLRQAARGLPAQLVILALEGREQALADAVDRVGRVERGGREPQLRLVGVARLAHRRPERGDAARQVARVVAAERKPALDDALRGASVGPLLLLRLERRVHLALLAARVETVQLQPALHLVHGPGHKLSVRARLARFGHLENDNTLLLTQPTHKSQLSTLCERARVTRGRTLSRCAWFASAQRPLPRCSFQSGRSCRTRRVVRSGGLGSSYPRRSCC